MRAPNGFGSCIRLSGNRRNLYAVRITAGWTDDGKQIYKYVSYHKTKKEAMIALANYNHNPYNLDSRKITFEKLFNQWILEQQGKMTPKNISSYKSAYKNCSAVYKMKFTDIKKSHIQSIIDSIDKSLATKNKTKQVFSKLYAYALENDLATKDYSKFVEVSGIDKTKKAPKTPFNDEQIATLWELSKTDSFYELVLILIYTGMRIQELLLIENNNVFLEEQYMVGGIKTAASKNRKIPIADKILPFIIKLYNPKNQFLVLNSRGEQYAYHAFYKQWNNRMEKLNWNFTIHSTRHTTATMLSRIHTPLIITQRILGHAPNNITELVYIHTQVDEMLEWVNKL